MQNGTQARRQAPDDETDKVRQVVSEFEKLRATTVNQAARLVDSDKALAFKDGEIAALERRLSASESARSYYQTFAVQMAGGLNEIMRIVGDVFQRADDAAKYDAEASERAGSPDLPAFELPLFLQRMRDQEQQDGQA